MITNIKYTETKARVLCTGTTQNALNTFSTNQHGDKNMSDSTLTKAINLVNNFATMGHLSPEFNIFNMDKESKRALMSALAVTYGKRRGKDNKDCPYGATKSAIYHLFKDQLDSWFVEQVRGGMTDDQIIKAWQDGATLEHLDEVIEQARTHCDTLEDFYTQMSVFAMGPNSLRWALHAPTIRVNLLPDHTGDAPYEDIRNCSVGDIDHTMLLQQLFVWGIVRDRINGACQLKKAKPFAAFRRLNAEIAENQYTFDENIEEVLVEHAGQRRHVRTQGWGTAHIDWLEKQIFQQENPVEFDRDGRVVECTPYPYDVREQGEQLKKFSEWRSQLGHAIEVRDWAEPLIKKLKDGCNFSSTTRAKEARKAVVIDLDRIGLSSTPENYDVSYDIAEVVPDKLTGQLVQAQRTLYIKEFNRHDKEAIKAFLDWRSVERAKARMVDEARLLEIHRAKLLTQMGL